MPETIDALQIEIKGTSDAAEKSVQRLIDKLGALQGALNLDFGSGLSDSLGRLSDSLSNLNGVIRSFDTKGLRSINSSLGSLSKLATGTTNASKSIAKDTTAIGKAVDEATNKFAKSWNISDKAGIEQVREIMGILQEAVSKGLDTTEITRDLENVSRKFSDFGFNVDNTYKKVREILNNNSMILPKGFWGEFGDDAKEARGLLGIKNNHNYKGFQAEHAVDPSAIAKEINAKTGLGIDEENDMNAVRQIVDYLRGAVGETEKLNSQFVDVAAKSGEFNNAVESISKTLSAIPQIEIVSEDQVTNLQRVAQDLQTLQGLNISKESMGGIELLANAMGRLGGKSSAGAAQNIEPIANGIRALSQVGEIPNAEQYVNLASGLAKLGGVKVQNAAGLNEVARGLSAIQNIGDIPQINGLQELAESLSLFGRKTAANAVTVIPQLATAFNQLITTLSKAPTVSQNVIDLANSMANLMQNTNRSNTATRRQIPLLNGLSTSAGRATKSYKGLSQVIGKVYATYWLLFRALSKVREAIGYAADLTEIQNVVDTVFGDAKSKVEDFADSAIMSFGMSELSAKQFASRYQAMGAAMGITDDQVVKANDYLVKALEGSKRKLVGVEDAYKNLGDSTADMSINLTKLTGDIASFYNMDYEDVATKMASVWTGQTRPMREFGIDLTQATLQEWMFTQGIDGNIKKMSQAEKTMIRYQYVMSQLGHVMNDYARTADTWANVTRTIGEQFRKLGSVIGTGFINAFRPALVKFRDFMNTLIDLVEKGINAIGKLLGWQIEISEVGLTEDADAAESLADGLGDAADNAKALNKQLEGFDKLNNLSTPSDKGGGGSGSSATGGGGGVSNKATDPTVTWEKYESDIESWFDLGETISSKLSDAMESINWEEIYSKAENFGKDLADFMNGLFTGEEGKRLFENLGSTIAGAINTVFTAWKSWADEFDFAGLGDAISAGIKKFLKEWQPDTTGWALGKTANGIAQALYKIVSDKETWTLLGEKIAIGINAFLKSMGEVNPKTGLSGWEALGGTIASTFSGIAETISTSLENIEWEDAFQGLFDGINKFIEKLTPGGVLVMIGAATVAKLPGLIKAALSTQLGSAIAINVTLGIVAGLGAITFINADDSEIASKVITELVSLSSVFAIIKRLGGTNGLALKLVSGLAIGLNVIDFFTVSGENGNEDLKSRLINAISISIGAATMTGNPYALLVGVPFYLKAWIDWASDDDLQLNMNKLWTSVKEKWGDNKLLMVGLSLYNKAALSLFTIAKKEWGTDKKLNVLLQLWLPTISELWKTVKTKWGDKRELSVFFEMGDNALKILWTSVQEGWGVEKTLKVLLALFASTLKELWKTTQDKWGENKTLKTLMGLWSGTVTTLWKSVKEKWGAERTLKTLLALWGGAIRSLWNATKEKWGENKTLKVLLGLIAGAISLLWTAVNKKWGVTKTLQVGLSLVAGTLSSLWKTITDAFSGKTIEVETSTSTHSKGTHKALGGAFYNGRWHDIAQFAAGGRPSHGSMFVAGESGAEIVGHVGGRTEVLNQSQLASTMYEAVSSAMASQNQILLKQNQLLSGILAKDYGISSSDIFTATQKEARDYTARTGRLAFGM